MRAVATEELFAKLLKAKGWEKGDVEVVQLLLEEDPANKKALPLNHMPVFVKAFDD